MELREQIENEIREQIKEEVRAKQRAYKKEWRKKNADKIKKNNEDFIIRKAAALLAERERGELNE